MIEHVNWRGVFGDLVLAAPASTVGLGVKSAARSEVLNDLEPAAFAYCAAWASQMRHQVLVDTIDYHANLTVPEALLVAAWTERTAVAYLRAIERPAPPPPPDPLVPGAFSVDQALDRYSLPLLDLAAELAATRPTGLTIRAGALPDGQRGEWRPVAGELVLDLDAMRTTFAVASTLAHELAHALDTKLATRDAFDAERFANVLGPQLLVAEPPVTLDQARRLAAAVDGHLPAPPATRLPGLPGPGPASVLAWARLLS